MNRRLGLLLLFFVLCPYYILAQITPAEGKKLNYRIIGFSFPAMDKITGYSIEIAAGNYTDKYAFQKNIINNIEGEKNKMIGEVPDFGQEYTWRVIYLKNHSMLSAGRLYHFSTLAAPQITDSVRLRIIDTAVQHKDDYVFLDGNKALYDMKGRPVWFIPKLEKGKNISERSRDLKITPFGTVTMLMAERVYEVNYDGTVLWRGPWKGRLNKNKDTLTNMRHHEFARIPNGHYMSLAFDDALWKLPPGLNIAVYRKFRDKIIDSAGDYYQKIVLGTLVEYDSAKNIVWRWRSSDYFKESDQAARVNIFGMYDLDNTHENAFYFDSKAQNIYISFRDLNRIVKIHYPDGKTLATYGTQYTPGATYMMNELFCGQHSCKIANDGSLYLFNNNICHRYAAPTIVMMRESLLKKDSLEKIWEFECPMNDLNESERKAQLFNSGGNVLELSDGAIFCCMGSAYSKVFIVSRNKEILWSAQPEGWDMKEKKWVRRYEYRGSVITRDELEHFIWNEPLAN